MKARGYVLGDIFLVDPREEVELPENYLKATEDAAHVGLSWTIVENAKPVACFGVIPKGDFLLAWSVNSQDVFKTKKSYLKLLRALLTEVDQAFKPPCFRAYVAKGFSKGYSWVEALGFEFERLEKDQAVYIRRGLGWEHQRQ